MKNAAITSLCIGTLAVGLIVGAGIGAWWSGRVFTRMMYAKPEVDQAFLAAQEAEWAARLRLNEPENTLRDLENSISFRLATIATWEPVAPADEQTRKARDRFLTAVKVYGQSYPLGGPDAAGIETLLAAVPGRSSASACKNGVCRLDDLRIARAGTTTNTP